MAGRSTSSAIPCLLKTSSRSVTRSVEATHDFEVTSYSLLDGLGVGEYVQSSTFTVDGGDWYIRFYADGDKKPESVGYASVYLHFHRRGGGSAVVQTKLSLSCLLREDGQVSELSGVATNCTCTCTFDPPNDMWGISRFVAKSRLRSSLGINNDCFTIRCVLIVIKESRSEDVTRAISVPQPNLHQDLERMLKDGEGADVTFSVGGQLFPAHRCMLAARSPVFKAELSGSMMQKATRWINIDKIEPAIFEALLHFIYTDSLPDNYVEEGDTVAMLRLLDAADRYGLDRLKLICGSKLYENIDAETAVTMLGSAEQHHCPQLREACVGFMVKHLVASCPKEILEKVFCALNKQSR